MDYIKISLIGLIALLSYYLLLQWPSDIEKITDKPYPKVEKLGEKDLIQRDFNDSEDSLLTFKENGSLGSNEEAIKGSGQKNDLKYKTISNDVLSLLIDLESGAFIESEMLNVDTEFLSKTPLSLFGNRDLGGGQDCPSDLGAIYNGENCLGVYLANSGFYNQKDGYIKPGFSSLEKLSLDGGSVLYIFSGKNNFFSFTRKVLLREGSYLVQVEDVIGLEGASSNTEEVTPYLRIMRDGAGAGAGASRLDNYTYLGPVFSTERETFIKQDFDDLREKNYEESSLGGWLAMVQRYFVSAWVPEQNSLYKYQARRLSSGTYSVALTGQNQTIEAGKPLSFKNSLYIGPKVTKQLNEAHEDLGLVVDYGFLWWLGQPIYNLMQFGYSLIANWGFAILFATLVLKAVLWPLSAAGYRSAAKMRAVAPKIQDLQQKYSNDKQKLGQEMMNFYKSEGVSPLGGCLPMLLQMPFFLAFYWVLLDMVELRHSPFVFWINDLSARDPLFVLPILNAILMYYSQQLMPTTPSNDPTQQQMQKTMKYMPVVFGAIFAFFPSGFVLYFTVQSLITLAQQALSFRKEGVSLKST
ncbi:MAG: membrane protein insertase YidC [Gammaproteobacteria bacterium]|nr:membrane protein insertase YidC [Gammaproteobacteria bacterium]